MEKKIATESGVQQEEMGKELKNTKDELTLYIQQVRNLTEVNQENESKLEAMQNSFEIAKSSKEEIKEQLGDEKLKNQALQDELELMREAIKKLQNESTMNTSKEKQSNVSIVEPQQQQQHQEKKDVKPLQMNKATVEETFRSKASRTKMTNLMQTILLHSTMTLIQQQQILLHLLRPLKLLEIILQYPIAQKMRINPFHSKGKYIYSFRYATLRVDALILVLK